jgi:sporulation protein YlmC with PRC-barrel domain
MILSELIGAEVTDADGTRVGTVVDVRFVLDGTPGQLLAEARLAGLLVSPHGRTSTWGYERTGATGPWPIAQWLEWLHRGLFLVHWEDVATVDVGRVALRPGYERHDAALGPRAADHR